MERKTKTVTFGEGQTMTFETGEVARQASGSVLVRMGDTVVFSSACASKSAAEGIDFFPLRVDYTEKFSSAGKTLGGFIKREGKPSEREVLTCRLIDRPLRPLFPEGYYNEVQVAASVWSYDPLCNPDVLAVCAASAALTISSIPLVKPIAAVRVGFIDGKFVINPSTEALESSSLDLVLAGSKEAILMIEGFCDFLTEEQVLEAITTGHQAIAQICEALESWQKEVGKAKECELRSLSSELLNEIQTKIQKRLETALQIAEKQVREEAISKLQDEVLEEYRQKELSDSELVDIKLGFKKILASMMRSMILSTQKRTDGRALDQIRPITIDPSYLPRTHGSCLFTRGETQTMAVCTLGGKNMAQRYEDLDKDSVREFYLQYSFPPYSVGEVGRVGPPGRREVGHGKLAERALTSILPAQEHFPYVIRLESNITESNGSSSMASVCGGCLALMDAGVPVSRPVSGIAMGLILEKDQFVVLSDILGLEDALGDMDFKITGDKEGITAFQMDIKVEGITLEIMEKALYQAKEGRILILDKMLKALPQSREEMSVYAPRIETLKIKPSKIAVVIGPGGKQIRSIIETTGVEIDINDDGIVNITSNSHQAMKEAKAIIEGLVAEVEPGKVYEGRVVSVVPFGAFIEVLPGKEGLCHISEFAHKRIENIHDVVKEGDVFPVKVIEINDRGQVRLSKKALLQKEKEQVS